MNRGAVETKCPEQFVAKPRLQGTHHVFDRLTAATDRLSVVVASKADVEWLHVRHTEHLANSRRLIAAWHRLDSDDINIWVTQKSGDAWLMPGLIEALLLCCTFQSIDLWINTTVLLSTAETGAIAANRPDHHAVFVNRTASVLRDLNSAVDRVLELCLISFESLERCLVGASDDSRGASDQKILMSAFDHCLVLLQRLSRPKIVIQITLVARFQMRGKAAVDEQQLRSLQKMLCA